METSTNPDDLNNAAVTAATTAIIKKGMKHTARNAMVRLQISLYEAGLLENLGLDVSQTKHKTLGEIQKAAILVELRHAKPKKAQVNAVEHLDHKEEEESSAVTAVELDREQYADITALHAARGKLMPSCYKRKPSFATKKRTTGNGASI